VFAQTSKLIRTASDTTKASREIQGLLFGAIGVLAFSLSLPATREAAPQLGAVVAGLGRAVVAGLIAIALLRRNHEVFPRHLLSRLAVVAGGVVVGFPLLTSIALRHLPSAHGAVVIGLLPASTAIMAVIRAGERPPRAFWLASAVGVAAVVIFAIEQNAGRPRAADLILLGAVALAGLGYAEGGHLAKEIGGWQVICWALVVSLPVVVPVVAVSVARHGLHANAQGWVAFAYVCLFSMLLGFFAWYRGLALGGIARVGQLQLAQPLLTLVWSALLLGEHIGPGIVLPALLVIGSVALGRRARTQAIT